VLSGGSLSGRRLQRPPHQLRRGPQSGAARGLGGKRRFGGVGVFTRAGSAEEKRRRSDVWRRSNGKGPQDAEAGPGSGRQLVKQ